jgi:UDP-glucose 4-epimerase
VSKLSSEFYLQAFRELHGLEYAALRYANVYGPRQDPHGEAGVVAIFCQRIRDGEGLTIFGDGEQTRDYVFVKDVAAANLLVTQAELPKHGGLDSVAFNVGTGVETSVNGLAEALIDIAGSDADIDYAEARVGELLRSSLDCTDTIELGWDRQFGLIDGLRETYESIAGAVA